MLSLSIIHYADSEKGRAATRVVKMSAEKTVIHNPHPGTNTKVRYRCNLAK